MNLSPTEISLGRIQATLPALTGAPEPVVNVTIHIIAHGDRFNQYTVGLTSCRAVHDKTRNQPARRNYTTVRSETHQLHGITQHDVLMSVNMSIPLNAQQCQEDRRSCRSVYLRTERNPPAARQSAGLRSRVQR